MTAVYCAAQVYLQGSCIGGVWCHRPAAAQPLSESLVQQGQLQAALHGLHLTPVAADNC